ncbi:MAG: hypothetical protein JSS61_02920 [Verrucomicrobia bacterium]|nr:hypothetical protein [Verrucomicrobiota bacterium]
MSKELAGTQALVAASIGTAVHLWGPKGSGWIEGATKICALAATHYINSQIEKKWEPENTVPTTPLITSITGACLLSTPSDSPRTFFGGLGMAAVSELVSYIRPEIRPFARGAWCAMGGKLVVLSIDEKSPTRRKMS